MTWEDIKHFKPSEFDSPDEPGSGMRMDLAIVEVIDRARARAMRPIKINSGVRSQAHNDSLPDSVKDSAHVKGKAADVGTPNSYLRFVVVDEALRSGIRRIGIGSNFVHLDNDTSLPQDVIWVYSKNTS